MKQFATIFAALTLNLPAFATQAHDLVCPDSAALSISKGYSVSHVIAPDRLYTYMGLGEFNTDKKWFLIIGPVAANSWENVDIEAEKIINKGLPYPTIKYSKDLEEYYCSYETYDHTYVSALVADFENMSAPKKSFLNSMSKKKPQ
ncbi:DUF4949 domain-containing protein [Fluoribacter gormanii]|uniref:DUF4949 domain-containing protein n=1 Tax=Fluoribacter gormanii TaxID=464 RepID=UPI001041B543|nr:DUF4949 domain-containing protein [Fluoribacter gormanii]